MSVPKLDCRHSGGRSDNQSDDHSGVRFEVHGMGWSSDVDHTFETLRELPRLRSEDRIRRTNSDSSHRQAMHVVGLEENNHCLLWGQEDVYFVLLDAAYLNSSLLCDSSRYSSPPGILAMSVPISKHLLGGLTWSVVERRATRARAFCSGIE
jgi:hypothetical protein